MTRECHVRICERGRGEIPGRLGKMRTRRDGSCWRKADVRARRREGESLRIGSAFSRRSYRGRICPNPGIGTLVTRLYDVTHAPFAVVVSQPLAI